MPIDAYPCVASQAIARRAVEHGLPAHLRRPADVRADDVVGAAQLGRHPRIVIGQAEPQRADAEPVQQLAQADVPAGVGVPLRQDDHGAPASRSDRSGK